MTIHTVNRIDGIANVTCDGGHYFLVYEGGLLKQWGSHNGQITSGKLDETVEYLDNEQEMIDRIIELGLEFNGYTYNDLSGYWFESESDRYFNFYTLEEIISV